MGAGKQLRCAPLLTGTCRRPRALQMQPLTALTHTAFFCSRALAWQAKRAVHLQAWFVRALDAMRAAHGPANPVTISALMTYGQCMGARVGWQQATKMLGDYLTQLKAAGLGASEGEPLFLNMLNVSFWGPS